MGDLVLNALEDTKEKTIENLALIEETFTAAAIPNVDRESFMYNDFMDSIRLGARAIKDYVEGCGVDNNRDLLIRYYNYLDEVRCSLEKIGMLKGGEDD